MSSLILLEPSKFGVTFAAEAEAMRDTALAESGIIAKVATPDDNNKAANAQRLLREVIKAVESARKAAKAPILDYGRAIDDAAAKFVSECKEEEMRIARLVGDFQELENAKVRAAEAARLLEQNRLEEERMAAIRKAQEEERAKLAKLEEERRRLAEEAAMADAARRAEIAKLEAETKRQLELAAAASAEKQDAINESFNRANASIPVVAPVRASGQVVKEDWEITVTDIWALARAHPMCVEITPRLSEIRALLDARIKVSGVDAKRVTKASVRTTTSKAITIQ